MLLADTDFIVLGRYLLTCGYDFFQVNAQIYRSL